MITLRGVKISLSRDMRDSWEVGATGSDEYTFDAKELTPNTTYYLQAWATNEYGTGYSEVTRVATQEDTPVVTYVGYTNISQTTATATARANGGYYAIASYTFKLYAVDGTLLSTDTISSNYITYANLTLNTSYSVGVIATNTNGVDSIEYNGGAFSTTALPPTVSISSFTASTPTTGSVTYSITSTESIWEAWLVMDTNSDFSTATKIPLPAQTGSGTQAVALTDTTKTYYVKVHCESLSGLIGESSASSIEPLPIVTITNITSEDTSASVTISIS